jgi:hypothetical protein
MSAPLDKLKVDEGKIAIDESSSISSSAVTNHANPYPSFPFYLCCGDRRVFFGRHLPGR